MKNPLNKRIFRMLGKNRGKYIALFLFTIICIGVSSGFLVAVNTLKTGYDSTFENYNIEDGHFEGFNQISDELINKLQEKDIKIYPIFSKDIALNAVKTLRVYEVREEINLIALIDGAMPEAQNEIALDRLFAGKNDIKIGDTIKLSDKDFLVSGIVAFSDYSCLFKNNSDAMFEVTNFGVGAVTKEAFSSLKYNEMHYKYAWENLNKDMTDLEVNEHTDDILRMLIRNTMLKDFARQKNNKAIMFSGQDFINDRVFIMYFLYILIVIIAFLYAIIVRNTVEQESKTIGTLLAFGYTKGELIRHYSLIPLVVTLFSALIGNILGYTVLDDVFTYFYIRGYSLIPSKTIWNEEAFVLTTIIPCIIIVLIIFIMLHFSLKTPIQKFLRGELKNNKQKRTLKLGNMPFFTRFRVRIIAQNLPGYIIMFIGILFGCILMAFSLMMPSILTHYQDEVLNNQFSNYRYILRYPMETKDENAEKFSAYPLMYGEEEVLIFGVSKDSKYLPRVSKSLETVDAVVSNGLISKFHLEKGDEITLNREFSHDSYKFTVGDSIYYPATFTIFINIQDFNRIFNINPRYFTGYLSNEEIIDLNRNFIASIHTGNDLIKSLVQMMDSQGTIFNLLSLFSVVLFLVIIYLLSRQVIERNQRSISKLKILGYQNSEINSLYHRATGIMVVVSFIFAIPIMDNINRFLYNNIMTQFIGWFEFYIAPWVYPAIVLSGILSYLVISIFHAKTTSRISAMDVLKNME